MGIQRTIDHDGETRSQSLSPSPLAAPDMLLVERSGFPARDRGNSQSQGRCKFACAARPSNPPLPSGGHIPACTSTQDQRRRALTLSVVNSGSGSSRVPSVALLSCNRRVTPNWEGLCPRRIGLRKAADSLALALAEESRKGRTKTCGLLARVTEDGASNIRRGWKMSRTGWTTSSRGFLTLPRRRRRGCSGSSRARPTPSTPTAIWPTSTGSGGSPQTGSGF